jgi:predicted esterase
MDIHPHIEQAIATRGELLANAQATMIIIHGRGGTNHQALDLVKHINVDGFSYLAPQAHQFSWYPYRFLVPRAQNEPHLSAALTVIDRLVKQIQATGLSSEKIMLLGFSQGACLVSEYAIRNPRRFGGVCVLSGGLIGADDELTGYEGSLANTPVFLGCSDVDEHIPVKRVHQSSDIFKSLHADVEKRIYPNMGHTINKDEMDYIQYMMHNIITQ